MAHFTHAARALAALMSILHLLGKEYLRAVLKMYFAHPVTLETILIEQISRFQRKLL